MIVTLGFDDGYADQYITRVLLAAHGMHATFFITSTWVGTPGHLTWAQLQDLYADGNEIGGHSLTHATLKSLQGDDLLHEIALFDAQSLLERDLIEGVDAHLHPIRDDTAAIRLDADAHVVVHDTLDPDEDTFH